MDNLLKVVKNRYEAVIVASREARRLNNLQRLSGADRKAKVTVTALDRLAKGDIKWEYGSIEDLKLDSDLKENRRPLMDPIMPEEAEIIEEPEESEELEGELDE